MPAVRFDNLKRRLAASRAGESEPTRRDRQLARRLARTFEGDLELADVKGIHFYVQNGTVSLYGTVRHALDRDLLVSLVRELPGVKAVVPHLQVVDPQHQSEAVTFFGREPES